ncbi:MAG TPA: Asp-tRNA(Asn)/Glu-tRNA(Gln) amidotransferase subunit GatC [Bryobacteraceae bacterium]|nr:Asp-tRNA(Asn)/Glu-tRNA(Gln) amidotransferase subunit GatC [Bryobacteraceae bacterium]
MKLTTDEVRYVADLANLRLSDEEIVRMSHDLAGILTHVEQLNELDVEDVAPMAQVLYEADEIATLREDHPQNPLTNPEAVANAPISGAGYYKVPLVIEK